MGKYSYPIIDCGGHVMEGSDFYEHYVEDEFKQAAREVVAKFAGSSRGISRPDEITIEATVGLMGEDRLMRASDYPHFDCRFPHTN